jgi:hypothetical protein
MTPTKPWSEVAPPGVLPARGPGKAVAGRRSSMTLRVASGPGCKRPERFDDWRWLCGTHFVIGFGGSQFDA